MDNRENIDLIKEKIDIVNFIGKYVKLKPAGKNFVGLCPFHQEKTPSFSVNTDLGIYKCFGCGNGGDIIKFVQEIEKIDFPEALEKLAKEAGVELEKHTLQKRNPIEEINELAKRYFIKELYAKENSFALKYAYNRGLDDKTIASFGIGYSSGDGKMFASFKKYKKYTDAQLLNSGLFISKDKVIKETFRKRLMFPIFNINNKVVAFTGRILPNNDYGPKYLNSPETEIYQKRNTLYGLNFAKSNIRREDLCIVVEGTTHVIATFQAGFPIATAPLGTGLTIQQLELISKYTKNVLFIFDNDTAGQNALERAFVLASQLNLNSFAANTGKYNDIDELYRHEPTAVSKLIENKSDCFSYLVASRMTDFDSSSLTSFNSLTNYVFSLISEIKDEALKTFFLSKASSITGIDFSRKESLRSYNTIVISTDKPHLSLEELYLKAILIQNRVTIPKHHSLDVFSPDIKRVIADLREESFNSNKEAVDHFRSNTKAYEFLQDLLMSNSEETDLENIYERLEKLYFEKRLQSLRTQVAVNEQKGDTEQVEKTLNEIKEITDKLKKYK